MERAQANAARDPGQPTPTCSTAQGADGQGRGGGERGSTASPNRQSRAAPLNERTHGPTSPKRARTKLDGRGDKPVADDDASTGVTTSVDTSEKQPAALTKTEGEFRSLMVPRGRALHHPAGPLLRRYATQGCPVDCGRNWTVEEMAAAIDKGPHLSAANPGAAAQFREEALAKAEQGLCSIIKWATIKNDPPQCLKISPLAAVPHKSRSWRAILDLSFGLTVMGKKLPSVNESSTPLAPPEALDQMGEALPRLIEALALAPEDGGAVVFAKLDIKDGFWRLSVEKGTEWNFAYVLPPAPGQAADDVELVVPSALQMGWCESPAFFCAASETARDVAEERCQEPVGSLPAHTLEVYMLPPARRVTDRGPWGYQIKAAQTGPIFQRVLPSRPSGLLRVSAIVFHSA